MAEDRHQQRQQRLKEQVDARIAAAQDTRGLLLVFTGNGKGKTTAAFGTVTRAVGHGMRAGVIQFMVRKLNRPLLSFLTMNSVKEEPHMVGPVAE